MQSPHSDEEDEDYIVEQDPDFARLVAEDEADLAGSGSLGKPAQSRKRSAVGQAVADAKRRKKARLTAERVDAAWSEMNAAASGATRVGSQKMSSDASKSVPYGGLSIQGMIALAAKKGRPKKNKNKKNKKKTSQGRKAALLKKILRGTSNGAPSKASSSLASGR